MRLQTAPTGFGTEAIIFLKLTPMVRFLTAPGIGKNYPIKFLIFIRREDLDFIQSSESEIQALVALRNKGEPAYLRERAK